MRRLLVVGQLATALVLLTGAGLVARTFARVASVDPGFKAEGLVAATVRLPEPRYTDTTAGVFFDQLVERVRRVPGVAAATLADARPLAGVRMSYSNQDSAGRKSPRIDVAAVGPDYFRTIGSRLLEGRPIDNSDKPAAARVGVINASLARLLFPGRTPIGKTIKYHGDVLVVGVVSDVLQRNLETAAAPMLYVPMAQEGASTYLHVLVRTTGRISTLESAVTQIVRSVDAALPPPAFRRMDAVLADSIAPRKFTFVLLGIFAALAAALAVVGLYAVLAHVVADRTREIGIRAALGADRGTVVRLIVRQGAVLVIAGVALGLVGSVVLTRVVTSLLYGVSARDPLTFATVPVLLGAVAMLATLAPAWRAARVDPIIALRAD